MTPVECLAWAISIYEGFKPGTRAWRNCNPGNLRSSPRASGTDGGYVFFRSFAQGWDALVWDLDCKVHGKTRTGLGPNSTLLELIKVWAPHSDGNFPETYAAFVADYLAKALHRQITPTSTLISIMAEEPQST